MTVEDTLNDMAPALELEDRVERSDDRDFNVGAACLESSFVRRWVGVGGLIRFSRSEVATLVIRADHRSLWEALHNGGRAQATLLTSVAQPPPPAPPASRRA